MVTYCCFPPGKPDAKAAQAKVAAPSKKSDANDNDSKKKVKVDVKNDNDDDSEEDDDDDDEGSEDEVFYILWAELVFFIFCKWHAFASSLQKWYFSDLVDLLFFWAQLNTAFVVSCCDLLLLLSIS